MVALLGGGLPRALAEEPEGARAGSVPTEEVGALRVEVVGLRSARGRVLVSLYDRARGFPRDRDAVLASRRLGADDLEAGQAVARFEGLPLGDYAVAVLHDENESGRH